MAHWISGQSVSSPQNDHYNPSILIIGAGTFGTSAAYHLAQQYQDASKITIVDRVSSPPKPAAAVDINRVIRTDYANPLYSNLAYEAWHAWFWSMELQPYFHQPGWLMMDDSNNSELSRAIRQQYRTRGSDPTQDIALEDGPKRWKGIVDDTATAGFNSAYFSPETGWCDAAGATQNFMVAAEKKGVRRITADITEILLGEDQSNIQGVKTANGEELRAERVLVAAGAWTSSLLSPLEDFLQIAAKDRIENQVRTTGVLQIYYALSAEEVQRCNDGKMPVIVYGQHGEVIPPHPKHNLLKVTHNKSFTNTVTTESGAKITSPVASTYESQLKDVPAALKREAEDEILTKALPSFMKGRKADHWRICYDARTPTEDFLICKYPGMSNLFVATGGSSHAYKFLPNIGKYICNVLDNQPNGQDKDRAWSWKKEGWNVREKSADHPKLGAGTPVRELRDIGSSRGTSKL